MANIWEKAITPLDFNDMNLRNVTFTSGGLYNLTEDQVNLIAMGYPTVLWDLNRRECYILLGIPNTNHGVAIRLKYNDQSSWSNIQSVIFQAYTLSNNSVTFMAGPSIS